MIKLPLRAIVATTLALTTIQPMVAANSSGGFAGMEFFGSSQVTRQELEKALSLKPGASAEQVAKGVSRLEKMLAERKVKANVDVANDAGSIIVSVDVLQTGVESAYPTRKLKMPHHVELTTEVPFAILDELNARREQLAAQGKPVAQTFPDGVRRFSDEPCNQYADKLLKRVPDMTDDLLTVISTDPDPARRAKAVEILNWAGGDYPNLVVKLLPALNDGAEQVRSATDRFIFGRVKMLPSEFPFQALVEALSLQLSRPSHMDRLLSLRCLQECAKQQQITLYAIKEYDLERLKQLESMSIAETIKEPAHALVQTLSATPDIPAHRPRPINEF